MGSELYFQALSGRIHALDTNTETVRTVVEFGDDDVNTEVSLQGEELVAWAFGGPTSAIHWYDARSGDLEREVGVPEVDSLLDLHDEIVESGPVLLLPVD